MKLALLVVLTAAVAFAQKVTVEFDSGADFPHYRTFALRQARLNSRIPSLNNELVQKRIDDAIIRSLNGKGLNLVPDHADLNVNYHFGSAGRTEVERYPAGWRGWGTRTIRTRYTEGTLVIDLRDTATHSLIWRAVSREDKTDPDKIASRVENMVKKSFAKYPPPRH